MARWKALLLAAVFIVCSLACKLLPWWALAFLGPRSILRATLAGVAGLGLALLLTALVHRWRPAWLHPELVLLPRSGLGGSIAALLAGGALFGLVFAVAVLTGGIAVEWLGVEPAVLAGAFLATVLNAAWEEYTFRGVPFSTCVHAFGPHPVALALGLVFGLAHLLNPHWTPAAILSTALAGFLICYAMLCFRNILIPTGLHVGWNYTQSLLTSKRYWRVTPHQNAWLSGGRYGLEASAAGIVVTALAAGLALVLFTRRRGRASTSRAASE